MKDKPVILVVDDDPQNIELLEAYLVPKGYEIVKAATGEEALGKLSGNQIDLILVDVIMPPGIDGFEFIRRVRQDSTHRLLPIIIVTVLREPKDRIKGIEAGCDDFISKPVDKIELIIRVRSQLKIKAYNDLMINYQKELESEITRRTDELKHVLEMLQQDITERKRLEEELLRAQKLESMGVLAGGIAHDFNNILTTILGNVSLAREKVDPDDEVFDLLMEAETASIRAQTLTRQLLTFAKGGSPVKETASISDILKESSLFVLRGSKSSCEFSIAEDLWTADVDVGQIIQIINNIVINANQAMPKGGTIQIAADNLIIEDRHNLPVKPGRYISISIID